MNKWIELTRASRQELNQKPSQPSQGATSQLNRGFWGELAGWDDWDYLPLTETELRQQTEQIKGQSS